MSQQFFNGTKTSYAFLGQSTVDAPYSDIFYRQSTTSHTKMASVNAGDPGLYVGGGTINLNFSSKIKSPDAYKMLHAKALIMARKAGKASVFTCPSGAPARRIYIHRGSTDLKRGTVGDSTVFLTIFESTKRPFDVDANHAMAYLVPPYGPSYNDEVSFLKAVSEGAYNIVEAISSYNLDEAKSRSPEPITELRTCLFSGGQFRRKLTSVDTVAQTIFNAFQNALSINTSGITHVDFESGHNEFSTVSH